MKEKKSVTDTLNDIAGQSKTLYDANAAQKIPLKIIKGNNSYHVAIELESISDDEFFALIDSSIESAKRIKSVSVDFLQPRADLAREKMLARYGYAENPNWKTATKDADLISALDAMLQVSPETETVETSDLLDDATDTPINLTSYVSGEEIKTTIYFREETKADIDEFIALENNQPSKSALASHKKVSKQKRLFDLYEKISVGASGYANDRVPAWHGIAAVEAFLAMQVSRLTGKL